MESEKVKKVLKDFSDSYIRIDKDIDNKIFKILNEKSKQQDDIRKYLKRKFIYSKPRKSKFYFLTKNLKFSFIF